MYGSANKLISRFELQSLADQGKILLKPGVNIKDIGDDKLLTREEVNGYAYCQAQTIMLESTGFSGGFDIASVQSFDWITGAITLAPTPTQAKRGTNYDLLISPTVSYYYGKTANLYCNQNSGPYLDVSSVLQVNRFGGTNESSYAASVGEVVNLSSILRYGNYVDFSVTAGYSGFWLADGTLIMEVKENGVTVYTSQKYMAQNSPENNIVYRTQIKYGTSYEFRGFAIAGSRYSLTYSNATGYRACNLPSTPG
jgi:hypothetical protein